jgi:hypothetical protein
VENRNGPLAAAMVTHADGCAERDAAQMMLYRCQKDRSRPIAVDADKAYDNKGFVATAHELNETRMQPRTTADPDARTTWHAGYDISLSCR